MAVPSPPISQDTANCSAALGHGSYTVTACMPMRSDVSHRCVEDLGHRCHGHLWFLRVRRNGESIVSRFLLSPSGTLPRTQLGRLSHVLECPVSTFEPRLGHGKEAEILSPLRLLSGACIENFQRATTHMRSKTPFNRIALSLVIHRAGPAPSCWLATPTSTSAQVIGESVD